MTAQQSVSGSEHWLAHKQQCKVSHEMFKQHDTSEGSRRRILNDKVFGGAFYETQSKAYTRPRRALFTSCTRR